ncbi:histidinol-phosphate transaminase [Leeia sp.]|uniref:histidinol-phosphate transaminase n=1 Tax=Leeia sp. TaxID=2884678 RepID=UPI0035B09A76
MPISPEALIRDDVRAMRAYQVHDSSGCIKLDANENPHALPQPLRTALAARLAEVALHHYPDGSVGAVKQQLRAHLQLADEYDILFGNGSDECIQLLVHAIAADGVKVMAAEPTFVVYRMAAQACRVTFVGVERRADLTVDVERMLDAIATHQPQLLFLTSPNNPTGDVIVEADLRRLIAAAPGLVVLDEAYIAFAETPMLGLLDDYPNLLLMRTFSKIGAAGLRLGYLIGRRAWLTELDKLRMPYNINSLTQTAACFLLEHHDAIEQQVQQIRRDRDQLMADLATFPALTVLPSQANMFLVRSEHAEALYHFLHERRILVRLTNWHPLLKHCIRISTGTPDENASLLAAVRDFFATRQA